MGMRGINATPKKRSSAAPPASSEPHPWGAPGLSRAERVIRFIETLPCTAGPLAGTTLKLRPWQREVARPSFASQCCWEKLNILAKP
jgi:hypothetical protein